VGESLGAGESGGVGGVSRAGDGVGRSLISSLEFGWSFRWIDAELGVRGWRTPSGLRTEGRGGKGEGEAGDGVSNGASRPWEEAIA
jgi:hypothetical protein